MNPSMKLSWAIQWLGGLTLLQLLDSPFPSGQSGTWGAEGVLVMPREAERDTLPFREASDGRTPD